MLTSPTNAGRRARRTSRSIRRSQPRWLPAPTRFFEIPCADIFQAIVAVGGGGSVFPLRPHKAPKGPRFRPPLLSHLTSNGLLFLFTSWGSLANEKALSGARWR